MHLENELIFLKKVIYVTCVLDARLGENITLRMSTP